VIFGDPLWLVVLLGFAPAWLFRQALAAPGCTNYFPAQKSIFGKRSAGA